MSYQQDNSSPDAKFRPRASHADPPSSPGTERTSQFVTSARFPVYPAL
jgi:hypothetical protein